MAKDPGHVLNKLLENGDKIIRQLKNKCAVESRKMIGDDMFQHLKSLFRQIFSERVTDAKILDFFLWKSKGA